MFVGNAVLINERKHENYEQYISNISTKNESKEFGQVDKTKVRRRRDLESLEYPIPGIPGEDYPIYSTVLDTGFSCNGQVTFSGIIYDIMTLIQQLGFCSLKVL